jgi:RimJ/RimL family protein N-acetyltransferase
MITGFPMSDSISTQRLQLIPLSLNQLQMALQNIQALEVSLNLVIMRPWMTDRVLRAIGMKIDKMRKADASQHDWFTYWLIVIKDENVGAGMLGFKGFPDEYGSTEIGYGIDEAYQGKGYMLEAVQALIDWAFTHPFCSVVTATEVENPASRGLLEKLGAQLVRETDRSTSWEIRKNKVKPI